MKLLIVGSRGIKDFDLSPYIPDGVELIISGGVSGVDCLAERYADKHRISKLILRPRYKAYGRAAPLKRNEEMVRIADYVLVVWDGRSRGTEYTIKHACKLDKQIRIVNIQSP